MLIDSHCHIQFLQYDKDKDEVIKRTLNEGVGMICVGTDLETSKKAIELSQKYERMWASVGLHPNDAISDLGFKIYEYKKLLQEPKVVAIGEVGLDYYRTPEPENQKTQRGIFQQFLELADKTNKPLIIHCREAYKDLIQMLDTRSEIQNTESRLSGVIHSFTSTRETAKNFLDRSFFIGLNGIITFTDQYNEIATNIPLGRILLETDAPYLAPEPYRGKRNEPLYVIEVVKKIAELKGISVKEVTEQTTENAIKLFKLNA